MAIPSCGHSIASGISLPRSAAFAAFHIGNEANPGYLVADHPNHDIAARKGKSYGTHDGTVLVDLVFH